MRKVYVIGIGAGDPEHVTVQAVRALNEVDVFVVVDKGGVKQDLVDLRQEILDRYVEDPAYRVVEARDPERDRTADRYAEAVDDWRRRRADVYARVLREEVGEDECAALLVWGDPTLYDSTLASLDDVADRGEVAFTTEVVPGISSVSALAARERTPLNRVGGSVLVTTGRRLAEGFPADADDVVVMLDARNAFLRYADGVPVAGSTADPAHDPADGEGSRDPVDITWGAYVGTPDEITVSGPLAEVAGEIEERRAEARERKGWIMDTYLLRRRRR